MKVLGIHGGMLLPNERSDSTAYHDAAAVLVEDGRVVAGIEEERLTRMKHCNCFPVNAVRFCLQSTNTRWDQIDAIAINRSSSNLAMADAVAHLQDPERRATPEAGGRIAAIFQSEFGVDVRGLLRFCRHHLAHAWSAWIPSGFDRSLILSLDGEGDDLSGVVLSARDFSMQTLREYSVGQSLGNLYTKFISLLSYSRFDEYKVMGLAPYGDPDRFTPKFAGCYALLPEGDYRIESFPAWLRICEETGVLSQARRKGQPFTQVHKDLAAAIQCILENIILHVLRYFQTATGEHCLAMAGGVAHNCTVNGKVLRSGLFREVFVQPAADDAGGALGAALWAYYQHAQCPSTNRSPVHPARHLYWGSDVCGDLENGLARWQGLIEYRKSDDIAAECAGLLASDAVVAWVQGRSEFGPRALGNRSIVADPRNEDNKLRINGMIKKREAYRPFAPSVMEECLPTYFELPPGCGSLPFMTFVVPVHPKYRSAVGAITHVDGTARVQSVSREDNPLFWRLIYEFRSLTGIGMVLNTSFNNNAEPIVDSLDDAVISFLTTDLSFLAIGDFIVSRTPASSRTQAMLHLGFDLPQWRMLVRRPRREVSGGRPEPGYSIESVKTREFGTTPIPVSREAFLVLQNSGDGISLNQAFGRAQLPDTDSESRLLDEIFELWRERAIILRPMATASV